MADTDKILLVLDLDETLIHASDTRLARADLTDVLDVRTLEKRHWRSVSAPQTRPVVP